MSKRGPQPDKCWMAWSSATSGFIPQCASVDRAICEQMIRERFGATGESFIKPKHVRILPIRARPPA